MASRIRRKEHRMDIRGRRVGRKSGGRKSTVGPGKNVAEENQQQILFEVP